jgi:peroxiredoxin
MKNEIQNLILNAIDLSVSKKLKTVAAGHILKDRTLTLSSKRVVNFSDMVKSGPLLITFVRGTWCPFCRLHMQKLRDWVSKLESKQSTIIVISSETPEQINSWLENNPVPYMFGSDPNFELADEFGVRLKSKNFFQAATFVIDTDLSVLLAYSGKRTNLMYKLVEEKF